MTGYGVFSTPGTAPRVGFAAGEHILDLGTVEGFDLPEGTFARPSLKPFLALGYDAWSAARSHIEEMLHSEAGTMVEQANAIMHLPVRPRDYVDFYSSIHHATNVGRLFRPDAEPLLPNWRHMPVGYHGRAETVVVSGSDVVRPSGQRRGEDGPVFGPSTALDFELEVGFITGNANRLGEPVPVSQAERHIFGMCLVNDWSARDLQAWEYQPLGPFLGKSFATTISPWIVPLSDVAPHRVEPPVQDPEVLPYLRTTGPTAVDLHLEVDLNGTAVTRTSFADMYWTMAQQLAHATSNGATARAGDLFASGTVSGAEPGTLGCLLEITKAGTDPIILDDGSQRTYLEDGDTVVIRGWCGEGTDRVDFGDCTGTVLGHR